MAKVTVTWGEKDQFRRTYQLEKGVGEDYHLADNNGDRLEINQPNDSVTTIACRMAIFTVLTAYDSRFPKT